MNKELKKVIGRALTGGFFWALFTLYGFIKGLDVELVETIVLFEVGAIFMPYVVEYIHDTLK